MKDIFSSWHRRMLQIDSELKDPLTILKFAAQELQSDCQKNPQAQQKIRLILRQVERMCAVLHTATGSSKKY